MLSSRSDSSALTQSEPEHLSYAMRLGLFGPGTSFPSFAEFVKDIKRGDVGAMEVLAMQVRCLSCPYQICVRVCTRQ